MESLGLKNLASVAPEWVSNSHHNMSLERQIDSQQKEILKTTFGADAGAPDDYIDGYQSNNNPFQLFPAKRRRDANGFGVMPLLPPAPVPPPFPPPARGGFGMMQPPPPVRPAFPNNFGGGYDSGSDAGDGPNAEWEKHLQGDLFSLNEDE